MKLLLHPRVKAEYAAIAKYPPQAIMLVGPVGSGKACLLQNLADEVTEGIRAGHQFLIEPLDGKKTIGIDQIRDLKALLKLKHRKRRVVLIPEAYRLTEDAQNSMLKILEEPPASVHFLIGVRSQGELLGTIRSRCRVWQLLPVPPESIKQYFNTYDARSLDRAMRIADGRIGLLHSILEKQDDHPLIEAIDRAKELLALSTFDRLVNVDAYAKDKARDALPLLIDALELVCKAAMEQAASHNNMRAMQAWQNRTSHILEARNALSENAQSKLVLTNLFLTL